MIREEIIEMVRHLDLEQLLQLQRLLDQLAAQRENQLLLKEPDQEEPESD